MSILSSYWLKLYVGVSVLWSTTSAVSHSRFVCDVCRTYSACSAAICSTNYVCRNCHSQWRGHAQAVPQALDLGVETNPEFALWKDRPCWFIVLLDINASRHWGFYLFVIIIFFDTNFSPGLQLFYTACSNHHPVYSVFGLTWDLGFGPKELDVGASTKSRDQNLCLWSSYFNQNQEYFPVQIFTESRVFESFIVDYAWWLAACKSRILIFFDMVGFVRQF